MQQNPILAVLKLIALTAFTVALFFVFVQYESMEKKILETEATVGKTSTAVSSLKRSVDGAAEEARLAKAAAENTLAELQRIADLAAAGRLAPADGGGGGDGETGTPETTPPAKRTASVIAGKKVYPRNPGWTVLCDATTNADPKRRLPEDNIDWSGVLNDYVTGEPKGLSYFSDDRTSTVVTLWTVAHDQLARRKTSNYQEWNANLAERNEESPDRRVYMIYLRKGVRWHDPAPEMTRKHPWLKGERFVDARDVKFTYDLVRNENTATPLKVYFENIESVEALDDHTVKVTWKEPDFYARATTLELQPLPFHIWGCDPDGKPYGEPDVYTQFAQHWFSKSMCGNGPYRLVEYKRSEYFKFERYEDYWGQRAPCAEYWAHIVPDDTARLARFWNDNLVFMILTPPMYTEYVIEGNPERPVYKYEKFHEPPPGNWNHTYFRWVRPTYAGFGWNQRKPLFSDKRVRRALTLALNRPAIPEKFFLGLGQVIAVGESVLSIYFPKHLQAHPFDLQAAAKLLEEAGWKDTDGDGIRDKMIDGRKVGFEFSLLISSSSPTQRQICQMYKEDLLSIGVKLNIDPAESALWGQRIHDRDFDGFIIFWTAGFDSNPKQLWDSSKVDDTASNNYTGFADPEADKIFEELHTTFDYPSRIEKLHRWYEIQFDAQPYTWIWSIESPIILNADWRMPEPQLITPKIDRRLVFRWKKRP